MILFNGILCNRYEYLWDEYKLFELLKFRLTREQKITVFASWLGWSLDGYDLVLMLFVISSVNQLFFPTQDPTLSLLATFATYTVALIMRPLGGALFGNFGDRVRPEKYHDDYNYWHFQPLPFLPACFQLGIQSE